MASASPSSSIPSIEDLLDQFINGTVRKRKGLIPSLEKRAEEISKLGLNALTAFDPKGDDWAAGFLLQLINRFSPKVLSEDSSSDLKGWFLTSSEVEIDYSPLQNELLRENFEEADRFTSAILRELAGKAAVDRGYIYFSEVDSIPGEDLITIDRLWKAYSQGKFGFSRQSSLLKSLDGIYERLWLRIGWKKDGVWTRYPSAFTWSMQAPDGHMPLVNQLRGVRLMHAILNHPALADR